MYLPPPGGTSESCAQIWHFPRVLLETFLLTKTQLLAALEISGPQCRELECLRSLVHSCTQQLVTLERSQPTNTPVTKPTANQMYLGKVLYATDSFKMNTQDFRETPFLCFAVVENGQICTSVTGQTHVT